MESRKCIECRRPISQSLDGDYCERCIDKRKFYSRRYYDTSDMSRLIGVSEHRVRVKYNAGDIRPRRVPGIKRYLWLKSTVDQWIKEGKPPAAKTKDRYLEKAQAMCQAGDHSWMLDEYSEYYSDNYTVDPLVGHSDNRVIPIGETRICNFCGHQETVYPGLKNANL